MARPDKTREVIVSWLPASLLEQAQRLCIETGFAIGRLTTSLDATFGAFQRQLQTPPQETAIVLKIGYSHVHLAAIRGQEIVTMRSLLTGSIRELENLLFSGFSLPREEVWMMLDGIKQIEIPAITEAVKTNRLELMTHIGSLFSELRSKKLLSDKSVLYLSNSCVEEPELGQMITERFAIRVESLTGMQNDELSVTPEDKKAVWLSGASQLSVANMVPPVSRRTMHLTLPARLSAVAAILLAVAPLPFLNVVKLKSARQLEATQAKHVATQQLVDDFAKASKEQETLVTLAKEITSDIDKRGLATNLTRHLTEKLPPFSRLERIEVNLKDSKLMITGYTVDTETALRYLDAVKLFAELGEPEITIGDLDSRRIRFDITAPIGKKG
ncbi:MAG: hypothetical protein EOM80_09745 [Erysipelotrichia bacterium]|nr:hypothetical protein [Erysipelotrichia bacterium]